MAGCTTPYCQNFATSQPQSHWLANKWPRPEGLTFLWLWNHGYRWEFLKRFMTAMCSNLSNLLFRGHMIILDLDCHVTNYCKAHWSKRYPQIQAPFCEIFGLKSWKSLVLQDPDTRKKVFSERNQWSQRLLAFETKNYAKRGTLYYLLRQMCNAVVCLHWLA